MQCDLQLHQAPDIRVGDFLSFLRVLQSSYPTVLSILDPNDYKAGGMWLQETLGIPPSGRIEIYQHLAQYYQIPACQFTRYQVAWQDRTLRELHQLLWHEANQADRANLPYRTW